MIDLKPACHGMTDVLAGISDQQLTDPTPCTEYSVRALAEHVDDAAQVFAAIARGDALGPDGSGPAARPGDDWRASATKHVQELGGAWADPAAWEGRSKGPGADLPNQLWGMIALTELVVHGWDLARATGQAFSLPDDTLQVCYDHVVAFVPNAPVEGLWGPPVEPAADATLLDRILSVTGRQP